MTEAVIVSRNQPAADTLGGAVQRVARAFRAAGLDSPELDARILIAYAADMPRSRVLAEPELRLDADTLRRVESCQVRRLAREPVSRIVGRREFRGLSFELGPATLDPRPETETLVDAGLELLRETVGAGEAPRILDLGTGTGALLIALLAEMPVARGVGTDIASVALDVARRNAERHGVAARASFECSDWLADVAGSFDLVVSNPPYIPADAIDALEPEVALYDPRRALDGGKDGLEAYRTILADIHRALKPTGYLLLEVTPGAVHAVLELCGSHGFQIDKSRPWLRTDLAGRPRCVAVKARR